MGFNSGFKGLTEKRKPSLEHSPYSPDIAPFECILIAAVAETKVPEILQR